MKKSIYLLLAVFIISCGNETEKKTDNKEVKPKEEVQIKNESSWKVLNVKDEFGDIVDGKSTVVADFKGTMTNSAVADAELTARIQLQDSTLYTYFYEYNTPPQAQLDNKKFLTLKIKLANGEVLEAKQFLFNNMVVDQDKVLLEILLNQNQPIKVIADMSQVNKYSKTIYKFEIDPKGLKEVLK